MSEQELQINSYVIPSEAKLPLHLKGRAPFVMRSVQMILRQPRPLVINENDGRVKLAGAIEFQAQVTPQLLHDVCDPNELWSALQRSTNRFRVVYDPEIQRGEKETKSGKQQNLLEAQVSDMMTDIEANQFECPQLMWNLRAGETVWVYLEDANELRIYEGVATRPDTNHRHHAVIRFHKRYLQFVQQTGAQTMGDYSPDRQYGLVIYTDTFEGEAHRFFTYNFKGHKVSTSTAYYIESKTREPELHAKLARELMERSVILGATNVQIISNHLSKNSGKMITFGTMVEALKKAFPSCTEANFDTIRDFLVEFLKALSEIRPNEIGVLSVAQRQQVRETSVADQAIMWHGYFRLAAHILNKRIEDWREGLAVLAEEYTCSVDGQEWTGDLFSRENPLWRKRLILAPSERGGPARVVNNRQSREAAFEVLCALFNGEDAAKPLAVSVV